MIKSLRRCAGGAPIDAADSDDWDDVETGNDQHSPQAPHKQHSSEAQNRAGIRYQPDNQDLKPPAQVEVPVDLEASDAGPGSPKAERKPDKFPRLYADHEGHGHCDQPADVRAGPSHRGMTARQEGQNALGKKMEDQAGAACSRAIQAELPDIRMQVAESQSASPVTADKQSSPGSNSGRKNDATQPASAAQEVSPFKSRAAQKLDTVTEDPQSGGDAAQSRAGVVKKDAPARRKIVLPPAPAVKKSAMSGRKASGTAKGNMPAAGINLEARADTDAVNVEKPGSRLGLSGAEPILLDTEDSRNNVQNGPASTRETSAASPAKEEVGLGVGKALQPGGGLRAFASPDKLPQTKGQIPHVEFAEDPVAVTKSHLTLTAPPEATPAEGHPDDRSTSTTHAANVKQPNAQQQTESRGTDGRSESPATKTERQQAAVETQVTQPEILQGSKEVPHPSTGAEAATQILDTSSPEPSSSTQQHKKGGELQMNK